MREFRALATAMLKGTYRDRATVFFVVFFPLFFILIFGLVFAGNDEPRRQAVIPVGEVPFLERLPSDARAALSEIFDVQPPQELAPALESVRAGDAAAVLEQQGDVLVAHVSRADQVGSATVAGVLRSFVDSANLAVAGVPPVFRFDVRSVEDESLEVIQFVAPGMIGFGISIGATFGAALTLIVWRQRQVLRRIRLAPVPTVSVVLARVVVSLLIALFQLVLLIGISMLPFLGLQLNGAWYMAVPLTMAGTLAFLAIGLVVGAVARTPEGGSGLANLITLPMAFLSGVFVPLSAAPDWLVTVSRAMPMRYLVSGLSDVLVRGRGPQAALLPIAVLLAFTAVLTLIATRLFRWDSA